MDEKSQTIRGDGLQSSDFIHVNNIVYANMTSCFAPSEYAGDVYNIALGGRTTLIDVNEDICHVHGVYKSLFSQKAEQAMLNTRMPILYKP